MAAEASSPYTGPFVIFCLVSGGLFLLAGLACSLYFDATNEKKAREAVANTADLARRGAEAQGKVDAQAQGKVDASAQGAVVDAAKAASDLAASLKDLTVGTRLAMIGVFLIALGAVAAGADALGDASKDAGASTHAVNPSAGVT